ncbi:MAG: FeoA family protein, partial [Verrucomicrobiota bacterium]
MPASASAPNSLKASWWNRSPPAPPDMPADSQPLSSLTIGAKGVIAAIQVAPESRGRLMEMGLLTGTPIEVIRYAPLGDPI